MIQVSDRDSPEEIRFEEVEIQFEDSTYTETEIPVATCATATTVDLNDNGLQAATGPRTAPLSWSVGAAPRNPGR